MTVTINGTTGITTPDLDSVDATFTGTVSGAVPAAIDVNASAPADSVAIDASGNVGIGTTSPVTKLQVGATGESVSGSGSVGHVAIRKPIDATSSPWGTNMIDLYAYYPGYESSNPTASIYSGVEAGVSTEYGYLAFSTARNSATTERMRLDSSGDLIVGGTSSGDLSGVDAQLTIRGGTGNTGIAFQSGGANTDHWEAYANQSARFYIENNNTSNGAYLTYNSGSGWSSVSDARWKANWTVLEDSSSKISALNIGKYNMLNDSKEIVEGAKWDYGVKAQELVEVIPDAVDVPENLDDKYGVVPNVVFWHGVKALQEALAKIETLEATVADLQTRVTALETAE